MDVFAEIKSLNFPADQYVVVGGAAMAARGLKETKDIDMVVSRELFQQCKNAGWKIHPRPNPMDEPGLERDIFEIYLDVNASDGKFHPSFAELKTKSEILSGIPFCSLEDVISFKSEYGRPKDLKDIEVVKNYLGIRAGTERHIRARAVIEHNGKFLTVQPLNHSRTFLPGGHIENGESAASAVVREIKEELGVNAKIESYLGPIENAWLENSVRQWEIVHYFHVTVPDVNLEDIKPAEEGFYALWLSSTEFEKYNFLPIALRPRLSNWENRNQKDWWISTI